MGQLVESRNISIIADDEEALRWLKIGTQTTVFGYVENGHEKLYIMIVQNLKTNEIHVLLVNAFDPFHAGTLTKTIFEREHQQTFKIVKTFPLFDRLAEYQQIVVQENNAVNKPVFLNDIKIRFDTEEETES